ncbi:MAG: diguanylate cyclase, partial [Acidobacteriota bacterium]|nr:diguanylate cyclase [Acidobacteriota bacterium]
IRADIAAQEAGLRNIREHPSAIEEFAHGRASAASIAIAQQLGLAGTATVEGFQRVNGALSARATSARRVEIAGACVVIALLLLTFAFYFRRSNKLHARVQALLAQSRREAVTDHLTGLGNRRALDRDLGGALRSLTDGEELLVALYDLDGFKNYNDTFGHQAGDALLSRLSANLRSAMESVGTVYRMGGDEFCLLARRESSSIGHGQLAERGAAALAETGESFTVTASFGACLLPAEAATTTDALRLADQRLYQQKGERRPTAVGEVTAALVTAMAEHGTDLAQQTTEVSELARLTAEELGLSGDEVTRTANAAKLYDIGKLAIPDSVLESSESLDEVERSFVRRHPLIGARIVTAAPSLATLAPIVRSCHEHFDGSGFPEGLSGEQIPAGARVIAVCDAYFHAVAGDHATVRDARQGALAYVQGRAGTTLDPAAVGALATVLARSPVSAEA